jgi:Zn-dependent protease with chaperone function
MTVLLVLCGALALVLPGLRPTVSLRGHPRWFARLDASAMLLGLAASVGGLLVSVAVGAIHVASGSSPLRYEGHLAPGGFTTSVVSGVLLIVLIVRMSIVARRTRRARIEAQPAGWLGRREHRHDHDLVVLPTPVPVAYSVEGRPPQIVISEGLRDRFDHELVGFVIDHERAHLRRRHRRYLLLAVTVEALFGMIPLVARSTLALRLAVERAADEEATGADVGRRDRVGTGLERLCADPLPTWCAVEALRYRAQRLRASPVPRAARIEFTAAAGLMALAAAVIAVAAHATGDVPSLLATLRR